MSLLGFLSRYSAYPFQAGLFMVFSAPRLVFVVCVTFSLVFGISCSYLFSSSLLGSFWSCISHFLYFAVRVFSVCVLLRISCSLSRFLFTFVVAYVFFSATSSSIRKFSSLFLCLFVNVIEVKTLVFSSLFPRALLFSRLLFTWHF